MLQVIVESLLLVLRNAKGSLLLAVNKFVKTLSGFVCFGLSLVLLGHVLQILNVYGRVGEILLLA